MFQSRKCEKADSPRTPNGAIHKAQDATGAIHKLHNAKKGPPKASKLFTYLRCFQISFEILLSSATVKFKLEDLNRGFPYKHPLISGRIKIHPELQGELFFANESPTSIHLNSTDYHRHLPDMERQGMVNYFPDCSQAKTFPRPILLRRSQREENSGGVDVVRNESVQSAPVHI